MDRNEEGVVAIVVAVSAVLIFVLASLVVDLGMARNVSRQSQNSADASALAAGNVLYGNSTTPHFHVAVQAAKDYAAENFYVEVGDWNTCADAAPLRYQPESATNCISFQSSTDAAEDATRPDTVRVLIPTRNVDTPLGSLAGVSHVSISSLAEASLRLEAVPPCALCILGPGPHDLQNGGAEVEGGNIHFNGTVTVGAQGLISTNGDITVESVADGPMSSYEPDPEVHQPHVDDPLRFMSMPDITGLSPKTDPCTDGPGIYGSVDLNSRTCNLSPGLYVVGGSGSVWDMSGNGSTQLNGTGVTLYFTCGTSTVPVACATPGTGATIDASGNGSLSIKAPTTGPLEGLAIVYDRYNTATFRLTGNGGAAFTGTVYAPSAKLQMNGNGCTDTLHALIVVNTIEMNGNPTCLRSAYAESENVDLPPDELHLSK